MQIKREINGSAVTIVLTEDELLQACEEGSHQALKTDIQELLNEMTDSDLRDAYNVSREDVDEALDEMATRFLKALSHRGHFWRLLREAAIAEALRQNY